MHSISWSDHAPITLEIMMGQQGTNTTLWRNNTFIISQEKYVPLMKEKLQEVFMFNDNNSEKSLVYLKIYANILANRLLKIMLHLIGPDQVSFVKDPDSIRRTINLI